MFDFTLNNPLPLGQVKFDDPLNGFASVIVWPSGRGPAPAVGAAGTLAIGATTFSLVVQDFSMAADGGWLALVAPAARAPRFDVEVFSGPEGNSFKAALESRVAVNGPPELDRKVPAIVADCSLQELLGDICFRTPGWAWWSGPGGVELGQPDPQPVKADGTVVATSAAGIEVRLTDLPPRAGTKVELPCGTAGVVLRARVTWRAGTAPVFLATLGAIPAGQRRPPRRMVRWPAKVVRLDPFQVELTDEERPEKTFFSRARLMARKSDCGRFRENIPVQIDDVFEATVPTGGVSVLPVKVYAWSEASPAAEHHVQAHSTKLEVTEKAVVTAEEIDETCKRRKSHVERFDVLKR